MKHIFNFLRVLLIRVVHTKIQETDRTVFPIWHGKYLDIEPNTKVFLFLLKWGSSNVLRFFLTLIRTLVIVT